MYAVHYPCAQIQDRRVKIERRLSTISPRNMHHPVPRVCPPVLDGDVDEEVVQNITELQSGKHALTNGDEPEDLPMRYQTPEETYLLTPPP